jgi:hypothetical protein
MPKQYEHRCMMVAKYRPVPGLDDCVNYASFEFEVIGFAGAAKRKPCSELHYVCGWHVARMAWLLKYGCLGHKHGAMNTALVQLRVQVLDKVEREG